MSFDIKDNILEKYNEEPEKTVVEIPAGVKVIGEYSFAGCESIERIVIPEGVTEIGQYAFLKCEYLKEVFFPKSLKKICRFAFWECTCLKSIELFEGVEVLENAAFRACEMLESVKLPSTLKHMGNSLFSNCYSLESIDIPNGVEVISQRMFASCQELKKAVLPSTLTSIEEYAFESCVNLESIEFPESLDYIGRHAFQSCYRLKEANFSSDISYIGSSAFIKTELIENYDGDFLVLGKGLLVHYKGENKNIVLPENIKAIGERAFAYREEIESIKLPEGIENIMDYAFEGCTSLKDVQLPNTLKYIGAHAFSSCKELKVSDIPQDIQNIGPEAFYDTPVLDKEEVILGKCLISYKGREQNYTVPENVSTICGGAFKNSHTLKNITIGKSVKKIGERAFEWCEMLKKVSIEGNIEYFGENCFDHCENTEIDFKPIPDFYMGENALPPNNTINSHIYGKKLKVFLEGELPPIKSRLEYGKKEGDLYRYLRGEEQVFEEMEEGSYKDIIALTFYERSSMYSKYVEEKALSIMKRFIDRRDIVNAELFLSLKLLSEKQRQECFDYALEQNDLDLRTLLLQQKFETEDSDNVDNRLGEKFKF
ncbi:MAG: leucine-rich repeat domain-containing protein [Firmicutes bacterium]|nr:leucine-rich repeat domain-containing protein [Bacillota bacterium]